MKPTLPTEVTLGLGDTVTWSQFCRKMANNCLIKYAKSKIKFTPEMVENLAYICQSEEDLPDDSHPDLWNALEDICIALEKSKEYENMTPEDVEVANATKTLADGLLSMGEGLVPEDTTEPILEASLDEETEVLDSEGNDVQHLPSLYPENREVNSQEITIITEASRVGNDFTMEKVKEYLETKFSMGEGINQLKSIPGSQIDPSDYGLALAYGAKLEMSGAWLCGDAINMLNSLGYENCVIQIASSIGKSASTVYNYAHTAKLIQNEMRQAIPITVYSEIVNRRYSEDEEENKQAITELANQAVAEKWSCNEARSHADMKQGKQPKEKKAKYRYIVILPGLPPYLTVTQPGYSAGTMVIDIKSNEYLRDADNKIEFVPLITEPTDEQIRELQEGVK